MLGWHATATAGRTVTEISFASMLYKVQQISTVGSLEEIRAMAYDCCLL